MNFYKAYKTKYKYRHDPVPGVRKYRNSNCMKRMKTTQERSVNCLHYAEGIHVRGKRKYKVLIDAREDVKKCNQRSWKKFRRKQWK